MLDSQTLRGKGIEGIMRRAQKFNKPVHAFAGTIAGDKPMLKSRLGLASLHQISPENLRTEEAMRRAESFLFKSVKDFFSTKVTEDTKN